MKDLLTYLIFNSITTRKIIYSLTGQILIIWLSEHLLYRRRKLAPFVICLHIKLLAIYAFDYYTLLHPNMDAAANSTVLLCTYFLNLMSTVMFLWTYEGNSGKTILASVIDELIATIYMGLVLILVNFIERRPGLGEMGGQLHPLDILIPLFTWILWKVTRKGLESLTAFYKRWEPRHQWVLWIGSFLFTLISNVFSGSADVSVGSYGERIFLYQFWGMVAIGLLMIWLWYQQHRENRRYADIEEQLRLLKNHEMIFQKNTEITRELRESIHQQMELLERQLEHMQPDTEEQTQVFLRQLKSDMQRMERDESLTGDIMIDSVLAKWKDLIERKGGRVDYECGGILYLKGLDVSLLAQMLELIYEEWFDQHFPDNSGGDYSAFDASGPVLRLKMTTKREQLLISVNLSGKWKRKHWKQLRDRLERTDGSLVDNGEEGVVCLLPVGS